MLTNLSRISYIFIKIIQTAAFKICFAIDSQRQPTHQMWNYCNWIDDFPAGDFMKTQTMTQYV